MSKKYIHNPLASLFLSGKVFRDYGIFTLKQIYNNVNEIELQSVYYFKIPKNAVLKDFKIIAANAAGKNEMLFSKAIEHHEAQRLFDSATANGNLGVILQSLENNAFKLTIGRQSKAERTEIHITYYWQFDEIDEVNIKQTLSFPLAVEASDIPEGEEGIFTDEIDYTMELDLELMDNNGISHIFSPSHDMKVNKFDGFTILHLACKAEKLVAGELIIEITYNARFYGCVSYYITDDGRFMQKVEKDGEIHYIRSKILEFLYYGKKVRQLEESLHNIMSMEEKAKINTEILLLALKHNILCSKTSLFAKCEKEGLIDIPAVHKLTVPILKKSFVFEKDETAEEVAIFAHEIAALKRENGIIADEREYELASCANSTATAIIALVSVKRKSFDKYLQFGDEFLNASIDFLIKYLAEGGEKTEKIENCFKMLLEGFVVFGERAKILQKIVKI